MDRVCIGVTETEFVVRGQFLLDGQVALLGVAVDEVAIDVQGEGQNGNREALGKKVLIDKQGIGEFRIESLLA